MLGYLLLASAAALTPYKQIALANQNTEHTATITFLDGKTIQYSQVGGCTKEPGAGMDKSLHSTRVYKDGYYSVNCMHDNMEMIADKYGDNRHSYQITTNVSIVRYTDRIERDDREKMTPSVCFNFCRTVPEMLFFGLTNGRDCYCTPYYVKAPAAGDGVCDLPCDGDSAKTCGGKEMMNIYEMHMCADTAEEMAKSLRVASVFYEDIQRQTDYGMWASHQLERTANKLKAVSAEGGDMTTHDYGQQAKVYAGEIKHAAEAARDCGTELADLIYAGHGMADYDFGIPEHIFAAEQNQKDIDALTEKCKLVEKDIHGFNTKIFPKIDEESLKTGGSRLFEPIMRSVDRWDKHETEDIATAAGVQTTCGGELAATPIMGLSVSECAEACNMNAPQSADDFCVAFNHYELTFMADIDLEDEYTRGWYGPLEDHDSWYFGQYYTESATDMTSFFSYSFFDFFSYSFFSYSYSWGWWYYDSWGDYYFGNYYYYYSDYYYYSENDEAAGSGEVYVYPVCFLLKEVEHVYKYNCDYGEEWKSCEDYPQGWHENGYPSYTCEWYAYNLDYCHREYYVGWDGEYAHSACCACGGGVEAVSLLEGNSTTEFSPVNATEVEPAFLAKHKQLAKREELRQRFEKENTEKKINPFTNDLPLPLVQNKCMARMSWASAGHQDTPQDTIDRCFGQQMEGTEVDALHTAADSD